MGKMRKRFLFHAILLFAGLFVCSAQAYEALNGPSQLVKYKASKVYEGYTLFSSMGGDKTYMLDMLGNVVHTWEHKTYTVGLYFVLLENGHILGNTGFRARLSPSVETGSKGEKPPQQNRNRIFLGGIVKGLAELDWDGNVVWEYKPDLSEGTLHHDFIRLPYGNTFFCSGNSGHLFAVTAEGEVVWEYISSVTGFDTKNRLENIGFRSHNSVFRVYRYGPDHPGLRGRELKPRGQNAPDMKGGWKPRMDLEGATQPGVKLWKDLWE